MAESETKTGSAAEKTYSLDRLVAEASAFLGVTSHVARGAFHGVKKKELTVDEASKLVKDYRARKVN
jgi:hypothetical protein